MIATESDLKAWRRLQAQLLLLKEWNADLIEGDDGRLLLVASRWVFTCSFSDLKAAEQFFLRVSGTEPGFASAQEVRSSFSESHRDRPPNPPKP